MRAAPRERAAFGHYQLVQQLAQGGMAQIWRAQDKERPSAPEVVVKTLHPRLLGQPLFAALFEAEARITRLLSHPGIARIVDFGAVKGMPYLAMERIDGWDLSTVYRALPKGCKLPASIALAVGFEMCRAVGHAHLWRDRRGTNRPIVHGDLSPSNLMVRRDGGVTLIDFGVAHMNPRVARGRGHVIIGKSGYLAPELLDDEVASPRSDVFSAGVMLHELLVGRHLFVTDSERETLRRVSEAKVAPPSRSNPDVTPALDAIVLRALERDPKRRFAHAGELADALERLPAPERALRDEVAAFVVPICSRLPRSEEPATTVIAPAVPVGLARPPALPMHPALHESTGTINERPRRRAVATELEARAQRPPEPRVRRGFVHALAGAMALAAATLLPLPKLPADWSPLEALDLVTAVAPTRAVDEPDPVSARVPWSPMARPLPGLLPPPLPAPRMSTAPRRHLRHPRHLRHARLGLVDPFRGR